MSRYLLLYLHGCWHLLHSPCPQACDVFRALVRDSAPQAGAADGGEGVPAALAPDVSGLGGQVSLRHSPWTFASYAGRLDLGLPPSFTSLLQQVLVLDVDGRLSLPSLTTHPYFSLGGTHPETGPGAPSAGSPLAGCHGVTALPVIAAPHMHPAAAGSGIGFVVGDADAPGGGAGAHSDGPGTASASASASGTGDGPQAARAPPGLWTPRPPAGPGPATSCYYSPGPSSAESGPTSSATCTSGSSDMDHDMGVPGPPSHDHTDSLADDAIKFKLVPDMVDPATPTPSLVAGSLSGVLFTSSSCHTVAVPVALASALPGLCTSQAGASGGTGSSFPLRCQVGAGVGVDPEAAVPLTAPSLASEHCQWPSGYHQCASPW